MLSNVIKLNLIPKFLPECMTGRPVLLSFFDEIKRKLGIGRQEIVKRELIPIETMPTEDEWSGIDTENLKEFPQSSNVNISNSIQVLEKLKISERMLEQDHEEAILRLLRILKDISQKLQLAICLPLLFQDENVLKILKPIEQHLFQEICDSYNSLDHNPKLEIFEEKLSHADPKLTLLLEILLDYPEINKLTEKLLQNVSPFSKKLIEYIKQFNIIVEERIRTTPAQERKYRLKLQSASETLKKSAIEIKPLETDLEEQEKKHFEFVKEISEEIARYESIIEDTRTKHEENIKRIVSDSQSEMNVTYLEMREKQESLENQIEIAKEELEKLIQENANREKTLHEARLKSEKILMTSLNKYDTEIGALHHTKEELTSDLNNLKTEFENLQEAFNTQAKSYATLREEKEEALMRAFTEQMENFSRNRAAKIIQRTWLAYFARITLKKKKKSKKK